MTYTQLKEMLAQNDIKLKELANDLGYTISAMNVNWSKKEISGKAEKSFLLYIKARNLEKENSELQKLISEKRRTLNYQTTYLLKLYRLLNRNAQRII